MSRESKLPPGAVLMEAVAVPVRGVRVEVHGNGGLHGTGVSVDMVGAPSALGFSS